MERGCNTDKILGTLLNANEDTDSYGRTTKLKA